MKGYPLTERDMKDLLTAGKESNMLFGLAGASFGFSANIVKDLMLNIGAPETNVILWKSIGGGLFLVAIVLAILGAIKQNAGKQRLNEIKIQTEHDED